MTATVEAQPVSQVATSKPATAATNLNDPNVGKTLRKFRLLVGFHVQPDYRVAPDKERDAEKFAEWLATQPGYIQRMPEERQWSRFCKFGYQYPDQRFYQGDIVESYQDLVEKYNRNGSLKFERITEDGPTLAKKMTNDEIVAEAIKRGLIPGPEATVPPEAGTQAANRPAEPGRSPTPAADIDKMTLAEMRKLAEEEEVNISKAKSPAEAAAILKAALRIK